MDKNLKDLVKNIEAGADEYIKALGVKANDDEVVKMLKNLSRQDRDFVHGMLLILTLGSRLFLTNPKGAQFDADINQLMEVLVKVATSKEGLSNLKEEIMINTHIKGMFDVEELGEYQKRIILGVAILFKATDERIHLKRKDEIMKGLSVVIGAYIDGIKQMKS